AGGGGGGGVCEPDLDPDRPPAPALAGERLAELLGQPCQDRLERIETAQVVVERRLPGLRLGLAHQLDRPLILEPREPPQVRAEPPPEPLGQPLVRAFCQRTERRDPVLLEPRRRLRPDPAN